MDTINVRYKFTRELTREEFVLLKTNYHYIENISMSRRESCTYNIGFSVPKFFSDTNVYLVNSSDFNIFKKAVMSIFGPITISAIVTRVDTPFTYLMQPNESFNDYAHIFRLLSYAYYASNNKGSFKNFEDTLTQTKECYRLGNSTNINKSNFKINIYDQYKKLEDSDTSYGKRKFKKIEQEFPDLSRRIRLEVSRKVNRSLETFYYEDEYSESYNSLKKTIFNEENISVILEDILEDYSNLFTKYGHFIESIIFHGGYFEYDLFRKFLKNMTSNPKTLETRITKARRFLDDLGESSLYKIKLRKVISNMEKEFKKQITW